MSKRRIFLPGEICEISGQYGIVNAGGKQTGVERGINAGDPFPPTQKKGQGYVLVDPTKTKLEDTMSLTQVFKKRNYQKTEKDSSPEATVQSVLKWTTAIAVIKSVLSLGLGIYFLYIGVTFLSELIGSTLRMQMFDMARPILSLKDALNSTDINSQAIMGLVLVISVLAVLIIVVSPALLLYIGYKLLTKEVFEKEMDKTGNIILRLRSGLGKVKPIEEMINSIFGRSRSAWDLQLWVSRVLFFVGILILFVAILQLLVPDLFGSNVDKAVFFGAGAGASVLTMALSSWLNPAKELQKYIVQNADIELATVSYVKQAELIDGWMSRALLSLKNDGTWGPESEVLASLTKNSKILREALENSVNTINATQTSAATTGASDTANIPPETTDTLVGE